MKFNIEKLKKLDWTRDIIGIRANTGIETIIYIYLPEYDGGEYRLQLYHRGFFIKQYEDDDITEMYQEIMRNIRNYEDRVEEIFEKEFMIKITSIRREK